MPASTTETVRRRASTAATMWRRHRRLWTAAGAVVIAAALYFGADAIVAYTSDAYVRSDLVAIAPEVAGIVKTVAVTNNQRVATGDPIATIDPEPYRLAVALKHQQVASLETIVAAKTQAQVSDAAIVDAASATLQLAQEQYDRAKALSAARYASQEDFDKASEALRAAQDRLAMRRSQVQLDERDIAEAEAQVTVARAEVAVAEYSLSRTQLTAPVDGYINNLTLRPGAYAHIGEAVVGIVDETQWRVVANFKENVAASVTPGTRVWVWLDSNPWHFWSGHVQGVGRGIARRDAPAELLPYVAPTTDWIRLRRRLPVTILLDPPGPTGGFFMGSDARVLFFP
jgi:membrane fusion protein, multidrug efflux system